MFNSFKKFIFLIYIFYVRIFPVDHGKYRIGRVLKSLLNNAVYELDSIKLELNPLSTIDKKLILGLGHDHEVLDVINLRLKDGGVFLDIGANIGYFSLLASKMKDVQVVSFEPSHRELKRFYNNILLNNAYTINVVPLGLSEETKVVELFLSADGNPTMNSAVNLSSITKYNSSIQCYFAPLDSYLSESLIGKIKVCKIDVEGYEVFVLKGMKNSLKRMMDATFIVEISPQFLALSGQGPEDIYSMFNESGFKPKYGLQNLKQYDEIFDRA